MPAKPRKTTQAASRKTKPAASTAKAKTKPGAKRTQPAADTVPATKRRTERARTDRRGRNGKQGEARTAPEPRENVDPPAAPDPRRVTFAGEPDKSFRFTKARRDRFLMLVRSTLPIDRACERIQCSEDTPRDWYRAGLKAREAHENGEVLDDRALEQMAFADEYADALTSLETELIMRVQEGARRDWKAAAWRLSVMRPQTYSDRYQAKKLQVDADAPVREQEERGKRLAGDAMELKIEQMKRAMEEGGQILVIGDMDLIAHLARAEDLPPEVNRDALITYLNDRGFRMLEVRDLGADPIPTPKAG